MSTVSDTWVSAALPLDRPEYSKQTEALLTDLLWRSQGSTLCDKISGKSILDLALINRTSIDDRESQRIVYEKTARAHRKIIESLPLAAGADIQTVLAGDAAAECLHAILEALKAPQSRSYKSVAAVPFDPNLVVLQTLDGIVNKENPANMAKVIEVVGQLGGAEGSGAVAHAFLSAVTGRPDPTAGFTGCLAAIYPVIAHHVWNSYGALSTGPDPWPTWPSVLPQPYENSAPPLFASVKSTPFKWFWQKWSTLCNQERGWVERLPERRWIDWALAVLRAGLAFAYLWEAEFYCRVHAKIVERRSGVDDGPAEARLASFLAGQFTLATMHPRRLPPVEKATWQALAGNLGAGYVFRQRLNGMFKDDPSSEPQRDAPETAIPEWIAQLSSRQLDELGAPIGPSASTASNTKEFVKYLMLQRASDEDTSDQSDLYYLAKSRRTHVWLELGPEWLVVETALLAGRPGRNCTLRQLIDDLSMLGISTDRATIVSLLEDTGLSTDSPDADDALVIESGF